MILYRVVCEVVMSIFSCVCVCVCVGPKDGRDTGLGDHFIFVLLLWLLILSQGMAGCVYECARCVVVFRVFIVKMYRAERLRNSPLTVIPPTVAYIDHRRLGPSRR